MTATIKCRVIQEVTDLLGNVLEYDSEKEFSGLTELYQRNGVITASASAVLWDPTDQAASVPASFGYFSFKPSTLVQLLLVIDEDDDVGRVPAAITVPADHWFILGSNVALADASAVPPTDDIWSDGVADVIDRIEIRETVGVAGSFILIMGKV